MKKLTVSKIHRGEAFSIAGHEYIALDQHGGGVLAIESNTLDCMAFGKSNDWRKSAIRKHLNGEYLNELIKNGIDPERDLLTLNIDLKETNGGREYGYDSCKVGLLTLEQYFRYNEHIPLADTPWWLATPWGTPEGRSPYTYSSTYAWGISTVGLASGSNTSNTSYGPRPALIFNSSLLVEVESDDTGEELTDEILKTVTEKISTELADKIINTVSEKMKNAW